MKEKSVGLVILWWAEIIIAVRVLLFTVPVIINKMVDGEFTLSDPQSLFIILLTLTSVFYLLSGGLSVAGFGFWKPVHFAAVLATGALTLAAVQAAGQIAAGAHYFYPLVFAVFVTGLAAVLGKERAPAPAG